jgi:hypothetical protein
MGILPLFLKSLWFALLLHPLHVSVTEIEYDEKDKALEIMMRVFMDDLETTMRQYLNKPELDILKPVGITRDEMMKRYLAERFKISLDKKNQKINYLGHEQDGDAFVFYMEIPNVKKWREIEVQNSIIMETYDDQSNLVHVTVRGKVKSLRLVKNTIMDKLTFDIK